MHAVALAHAGVWVEASHHHALVVVARGVVFHIGSGDSADADAHVHEHLGTETFTHLHGARDVVAASAVGEVLGADAHGHLLAVADRRMYRMKQQSAIRAAEASTSGEIVCVLARAASDYAALPVIWAALIALTIPWPLIAFTQWPVQWIFAAQILAFAFAYVLPSIGDIRVALAPRSIAVIGASDNANKIGGRPLAYLSRFGFQGEVYPINPARSEVQGFHSFASFQALPEVPDVAIIAVPGDLAVAAVDECAQAGVSLSIVMSSGFGESHAAGKLQEQAHQLSQRV